MVKINKEVTIFSRLQIYFMSVRKLFRGTIRGIFFKNNSGMTFIGKHVSLFNKQYMYVEKNVKFEDYSEIQGLSQNGLFFKDNVTIGSSVKIRPSSYYGVGNIGKGLFIGENSSIGPNGYIGCAGQITIGDKVMIGPGVTMIAENHNFRSSNKDIKSQGVNQRGIVIENNVWIGANVTVLDGVIIGSGSVIGAGTLVTKNILPNTIFINKRENKSKSRLD